MIRTGKNISDYDEDIVKISINNKMWKMKFSN